MLVLSRKNGESIRIGDDIKLTIVSIKGKRVKIGIEAPEDCRIVRDEMLWMSSSRAKEHVDSKESQVELVVC